MYIPGNDQENPSSDTVSTPINKQGTAVKIEMYSKTYCPYCSRATAILNKYNVDYIEYEVSRNPTKLAQMVNRSNGARTVPQIFINDELIGGSDQLLEMHMNGKLGELLGRELSA